MPVSKEVPLAVLGGYQSFLSEEFTTKHAYAGVHSSTCYLLLIFSFMTL